MKPYWKYIIVSLGIGFFAGAAAGAWTAHCRMMYWRHHRPEILMKHFERKLDLTDTQRSKIRDILYTQREKMHAYHQETRKRVHAEIRTLLDPSQQERFDAWEAKRESKLQPYR